MPEEQFGFHSLVAILEREAQSEMSDQVRAVLSLAIAGHDGQYRQTRKKPGTIPYIVHPVGTARLAIRYFGIAKGITETVDTVVSVAIAHDLLEDTRVTRDELQAVAGANVCRYVASLTKPSLSSRILSSSDRNQRILDQIAAAGDVAIYVKICDSMHNMSRPASTPDVVLRKAIDKAANQYLPLLRGCGLGSGLVELYISAINEASRAINAFPSPELTDYAPSSLHECIARCVALCQSNVLEIHDISGILNALFDTSLTGVFHVSLNTTGSMHQVSGPSIDINYDFLRNMLSSPSKFDEQSLHFVAPAEEGLHALYCLPISIGFSERYVVLLGFDRQTSHWITLDSITVITNYLAQHLVLKVVKERSELARTAAGLGVQLNLSVATKLGLTSDDLIGMAAWRERCQYAVEAVEYLLRNVISMVPAFDSIRDLCKIESRVKSIDSILYKCLRKNRFDISTVYSMQDIAGLRVVGPSVPVLNSIADAMYGRQAIEMGVSCTSVSNYIEQPTFEGYRAIHLILDVLTYGRSGQSVVVPCELQLRTLLMDAWASISHATTYKTNNHEKQKQMRELADEVSSIQSRIDAIAL